ncbi:MAG: hypothetical protein ACRDDF_12160 [Aeromonas sp.]
MVSIKELIIKIKDVFSTVKDAVWAAQSMRDWDMADAKVAVVELKTAAIRATKAAEQVFPAIKATGMGLENFKKEAMELANALTEIRSITDEMVKSMTEPTLKDLEDVMGKFDKIVKKENSIYETFKAVKRMVDSLTAEMEKSTIKEIEIAETEIDKIRKMITGVSYIIQQAISKIEFKSIPNLGPQIAQYQTKYEKNIRKSKHRSYYKCRNQPRTCYCWSNGNILWNRYNTMG